MPVKLANGRTAIIDAAGYVNLDEEAIYIGEHRVTEAEAQAIARGIARRHGLRGGRPALAPDGTSCLSLRLPRPLRDRLRAKADAERITESALVRRAIEHELDTSANAASVAA